MRAGQLRHWVQFVELPSVPLRNEFGEEVQQDVVVHQCHAAIEPLTGREQFVAQQTQAEVSHKVMIRYAPNIKASQTIVLRGRRFNVVFAVDVEERHREIEIFAKELQ